MIDSAPSHFLHLLLLLLPLHFKKSIAVRVEE
jgi:hypothetical protein